MIDELKIAAERVNTARYVMNAARKELNRNKLCYRLHMDYIIKRCAWDKTVEKWSLLMNQLIGESH